MSSVTVKIPAPLRPLTSGQSELKVEGATVGEVLKKVDAQFKGFGERVLENGTNVRRFINVFVNEDNIRDKNELDTEVKPGDTISILPSIAGGSPSSAGRSPSTLTRRFAAASPRGRGGALPNYLCQVFNQSFKITLRNMQRAGFPLQR